MRIEKRTPSVTEFIQLRNAVGWPISDAKAVAIALRNSLHSVVATEGGDVAGFGRVIGDGGLYFYIQDMIVHPRCQGRGVGRTLMNELLQYLKSHAAPGAFVGLMAAQGRAPFYERFGFKARDADSPGMYMRVG